MCGNQSWFVIMRARRCVFLGALSVVLLVWSTHNIFSSDSAITCPHALPTQRQYNTYDIQKTKCAGERRHIVFIKVHKAGSTTIANILFRFGIARNLTFMFPAKGMAVSKFQHQPWYMMALPEGSSHYDILTNHAVYNRTEIQRLFPYDVFVVAVLREPMAQLDSALYFFYRKYLGEIDKVSQYLKNPRLLPDDRYVNNSMAYELGLPRERFSDKDFVRSYANTLSNEIQFILILEKLDESLIILKRRLQWKLEDIIYIRRNVNIKKLHIERTDEERLKHRQMVPADYIIYEFFYQRLKEEISTTLDIQDEVSHFKGILKNVSGFCSVNPPALKILEIDKSNWNERFVITEEDCRLLQFDGLQFLMYAKQYQYGKY